MFGNKIKLDKELLARARQAAADGGYSGVEEFVAHCIEKELARRDDDSDEIVSRLEGLGYIA